MLQNFLVLGAGSAGLLAAITLKRKIPGVAVRVVRSREVGVIGVGESTTPGLPRFLFNYLGIRRRVFYERAEPTWKLGIRFLWGPRDYFDYSFLAQLDGQWSDLPRPNGFYCDETFRNVNVGGALMSQDKAFMRQQNGAPEIDDAHAFHLYNPKLVEALELLARDLGVVFIEGNVAGATRGEAGIESVKLDDGRSLEADFFIDASGFRSELLGKALAEPFVSFVSSLFCDRAVVGGWEREASEPILPYTVAETMDAGWCWQIDHERLTNRGYVFSSNFLTDGQAHDEFMRKNPRAKTWDHLVKFKSGRYERGWVGNVLGIGNACGFVEPLEATALMVVCWQLQAFVDMLNQSGANPPPTMQALFNKQWAATWDEIRDFLTLHYHANTRLDTPFWRAARSDTNISRITELLKFYDENGPTGFLRYQLGNTGSQFGVEGFLVMLVGNRVPYRAKYTPSEQERAIWNAHCEQFRQAAATQALDAKEALSYIRHPGWRWTDEQG